MSSGAGPALAHRSVASIRSAPTQSQQTPSTPHTPPRTISSSYGSPSTIRADDDFVLIEIGSRFIRAGFAGDSLPKATLPCGPEQHCRVGDFRAWQEPGALASDAWAAEHEVWRYDVRGVDLGLLRDRLDRVLRDAFTRYGLCWIPDATFTHRGSQISTHRFTAEEDGTCPGPCCPGPLAFHCSGHIVQQLPSAHGLSHVVSHHVGRCGRRPFCASNRHGMG